ncbi:MAG: TIGR01906 family membrane protein [Clostridiales bacterium]|nr:TIGR01906 family membrane protein [Clostridiales bacterium]
MNKTKALVFTKGLALGILSLFLSTSLGLGFIHASNFPYTRDIKTLNISESSGLSREELLDNYKAATKFLSPFSSGEFHLPSLKYSETGASHFYDCKLIFNAVYILGTVSGLGILFAVMRKKLNNPKILSLGVTVTFLIPAVFISAILVNFDLVFNRFHAFFFKGDTWIFDPDVDEIINILPADFFMHCAVVIATFWLAAAAILGLFSFSLHKKTGSLEQRSR